MNEPAQPIAYAKLDDYLKASPAEQKNGSWGLDTSTASTATTGPGSNASATAPANQAASPSSPPAAEAAPGAAPDQNAAPPNGGGH